MRRSPSLLRPSMAPDVFAELPVAISRSAIVYEHPHAFAGAGLDFLIPVEILDLRVIEFHRRCLRQAEDTLSDGIDRLGRDRFVGVTFEQSGNKLDVTAWATVLPSGDAA